ncbi:hypothetical protein SBV1_300020 [Verrucomicrobia bacterium]|nr:hypothetical protein SBV1_300020 [Verrucomicrobiota bacterium]
MEKKNQRQMPRLSSSKTKPGKATLNANSNLIGQDIPAMWFRALLTERKVRNITHFL